MTDTATVDLAAWLTRIWDEEERLAKDCSAEVGSHRAGDPFPDGSGDADYDAFPSYPWGSSRWELAYMAGPGHPVSVLARIAADREILEDYRHCEADYRVHHTPTLEGQRFGLLLALARLAEAYADRPGYREEWRP